MLVCKSQIGWKRELGCGKMGYEGKACKFVPCCFAGKLTPKLVATPPVAQSTVVGFKAGAKPRDQCACQAKDGR